MSCTVLTRGRTTPCSDTVGGLDYIELADYDTIGDATYDGTDTDMITAFAGTPTWYKYELNSTANNFAENVMADDDAGTTYFEQVLSISLKKLDKESKLLVGSQLMIGLMAFIVNDAEQVGTDKS